MARTGYIAVSETVNGGKTAVSHVYEDASRFIDATNILHKWLWLNQSQEMSAHVMVTWMRGETYSDHSVCVRYYVPGTVGHWFEIFYRA